SALALRVLPIIDKKGASPNGPQLGEPRHAPALQERGHETHLGGTWGSGSVDCRVVRASRATWRWRSRWRSRWRARRWSRQRWWRPRERVSRRLLQRVSRLLRLPQRLLPPPQLQRLLPRRWGGLRAACLRLRLWLSVVWLQQLHVRPD